MAQIFVSYSRKDATIARRITSDLERAGVEVWFDQTDLKAGSKWSTSIQSALNSASHMVVLISPDSMASTNVEDEWQYFLDLKKPLIPILVRPADVHFQLRRIQYVDFHEQAYDLAFAQLRAELEAKGLTFSPQPVSPIDSTRPLPRASAAIRPPETAPLGTRDSETGETKTAPNVNRQWTKLAFLPITGMAALAIVLVMVVAIAFIRSRTAPTATPSSTSQQTQQPVTLQANASTSAATSAPSATSAAASNAAITTSVDGLTSASIVDKMITAMGSLKSFGLTFRFQNVPPLTDPFFQSLVFESGEAHYQAPDRVVMKGVASFRGQKENVELITIGKEQWYKDDLLTGGKYIRGLVAYDLTGMAPLMFNGTARIMLPMVNGFNVESTTRGSTSVYRISGTINSRFISSLTSGLLHGNSARVTFDIDRATYLPMYMMMVELPTTNGQGTPSAPPMSMEGQVIGFDMPSDLQPPAGQLLASDMPAWYSALATQRCVEINAAGLAPNLDDIAVLKRNQIKTALIVAKVAGQAQAQVPTLIEAGVTQFIILTDYPSKIDVLTTPTRFADATIPIVQEYAALITKAGLPLNIVVGNQPNISDEGWSLAWKNGSEYADWWISVIQSYRETFPDAKIGFPALFSGTATPPITTDGVEFAAQAKLAIDKADFVAVNYFWDTRDGSTINLPLPTWANLYGNKLLVGVEVGPTDNITVTGGAMQIAYTKFRGSYIPACGFVLSGAGSWTNAAWNTNKVVVP